MEHGVFAGNQCQLERVVRHENASSGYLRGQRLATSIHRQGFHPRAQRRNSSPYFPRRARDGRHAVGLVDFGITRSRIAPNCDLVSTCDLYLL